MRAVGVALCGMCKPKETISPDVARFLRGLVHLIEVWYHSLLFFLLTLAALVAGYDERSFRVLVFFPMPTTTDWVGFVVVGRVSSNLNHLYISIRWVNIMLSIRSGDLKLTTWWYC